MYKNTFSVKKCQGCSFLDYQSTHVCLQLDAPFFACFTQKKSQNLFAMNWCNKICVCVRLVEWLHWWHTFLCNLLEKRYVTFIISWHSSLGGNFLADTLRYLSWPALSRSWHLAASGTGQEVMSHQADCWPHCITVTSVFLGKEAIWWPPWVEGSQILSNYSVWSDWWIKLACITTMYHCCIYSIVLQMNTGFPFLLTYYWSSVAFTRG